MVDGGGTTGDPSAAAVRFFPHADREVAADCHSGTPAQLERAADRVQAAAAPVAEVDGAVRTTLGNAVAEVDGELQPPMMQMPTPLSADARALVAASYAAAGVLRRFASAVRTFNDGKDGLRLEFDLGLSMVTSDAPVLPGPPMPGQARPSAIDPAELDALRCRAGAPAAPAARGPRVRCG
ncbi:MAG: hypothetical protein ACRDO7_16525 [Nocardioidaceae bacterium]